MTPDDVREQCARAIEALPEPVGAFTGEQLKAIKLARQHACEVIRTLNVDEPITVRGQEP